MRWTGSLWYLWVWISSDDEKEKKMKQKTYGQMVMERLTGSSEGRIDFMLQVVIL